MRWSPFFLVARRGEGDVEAADDGDVAAARAQPPHEAEGGEQDGPQGSGGGSDDGDGSDDSDGSDEGDGSDDGDRSEPGNGWDKDKGSDRGTGSGGRGSDSGDGPGDSDHAGAGGSDHDEQVERARRKLQDAIERGQQDRGVTPPPVGQKVDKYFGKKLPPVCAKLGCYLTDDGKRFYCVNPSCQKHKKRETKHTRQGRAPGKKKVFFRCPKCGSRDVDLHMFASQYECKRCEHRWDRD